MTENYSDMELKKMGISCGRNVRIHRTVLFFGSNVSIGDNVRIDCYSVITSDKLVKFGNYVHVSVGVYIFGTAGACFENYCNISSRCSIFTKSDDFTDGYMTNPTVPDQFKKVVSAPVILKKHVIIGCGSVILPGVTLHEGCSVGAMSLVNQNVEAYSIVAGIPIRNIGKRNKQQLLITEKEFESIQVKVV